MKEVKITHGSRVVSQTQKAFNVWGIVLAIWAVYRATVGAAAPMLFDEIILKPLLFIVPVLFYIRTFEHKSIAHGLWLDRKDIVHHVQVALLICIPVVALYGLFLAFGSNKVSWESVLLLAPIALGMSISEEVLSRGFVARHIWEESHSVVKTVVQASIMHMFLRIPRIMTTPALFGNKLVLFVAADLLLSVVLTVVFLWRKSLVPVIVVRFLYSFLLMSMLV